MIKKINIALLVAFVAMMCMKGISVMRASKGAATMSAAPTAVAPAERPPAPNVYYQRWTYFSVEDPISNRNGILLDLMRAIFPESKFICINGSPATFAAKLREDPNAVVVGFGKHPALDGCLAAPTSLAYSPFVLMTLRSNTWRYTGPASLEKLRIITTPSFLDYATIREMYNRQGSNSEQFKVLPQDMSQVELAAKVEAGEADAFVAAGAQSRDGVAVGTFSLRIMQQFRQSSVIGKDSVLMYVSTLDENFSKKVLEAYDAGMRRIDASGERRRIFDYYGIVLDPLPGGKPEAKK